VQVEIPQITNLLTGLPDLLPEERIENLVVSKNIRIEGIISTGHPVRQIFGMIRRKPNGL
jgi:hypothetical protein